MTSDAVAEKCRSYPFDLAADLAEVRNWAERDPEAVDALLRHLEYGRGLSR
jgi:thioredoxin-like negative regulator of GroEL